RMFLPLFDTEKNDQPDESKLTGKADESSESKTVGVEIEKKDQPETNR
ncbi:2953_t:CDS:1, partial [Ambispora gerdemannii]